MKTLMIISVLAASSSAYADEPPAAASTSTNVEAETWKVGIEPRLGFALPTSKLGANVGGGLEVDVAVAMQGKLVVGVDASLTQPSYSSTAMDSRIPGGMATYDIHQTELLVGATIQYRIPASAKLVPRVGLGPALHMLKTNETNNIAPGNNTAQQTKLGLEALAGVDYKAGPGYVAGDLRLIYSGLDTPLTGSSNAGNIGLAVGYRIVF